MKTKIVIKELLSQLNELCLQLTENEFSQPIALLSNASIGGHVRHSIEFVDCLLQGKNTKNVSYDNRKHDQNLEKDPIKASQKIVEMMNVLDNISENFDIKLSISYPLSDVHTEIPSNFAREITYNIEHIVHHMALIKIGIENQFAKIKLPKYFGVAQSTVKYKEQQAQ
ncbi:MAG: hypothetical protein Kow0079_06750 [Vicingaceae bacterium]